MLPKAELIWELEITVKIYIKFFHFFTYRKHYFRKEILRWNEYMSISANVLYRL